MRIYTTLQYLIELNRVKLFYKNVYVYNYDLWWATVLLTLRTTALETGID